MTDLIRITGASDKTHGVARSNKWPALRAKFIKNKACAVCGGKTKLQAHHVKPFHIHPELELDPKNLLALCEGRKQIMCHLLIGHGGDFRDINPDSVKDAAHLYNLMTTRQTTE